MAMAFERQPKESDKAFAAFSAYLSGGPKRSLPMVTGKLGKREQPMEKWSKRWNWGARMQAHGAYMGLGE